jgi:RNA polymerase sigma-70 factor (ECF subfamily)
MSADRGEDLKAFPATHWSLVEQAGQATLTTRRKALDSLLRRYLPAMRAHLLMERHLPRDKVEDLLQGFVSDQIVERNLIAHAEQRKGKFRSFLLLALNRYVTSQIRRETALKRSPRDSVVTPLDEQQIVSANEQPSAQFDREWAKQLVGETLSELKRQCTNSDRSDVWGVFEARIVSPLLEQTKPRPYDELARQYELATPLAAANLLTTAKRTFARLLRSAVAEYTHDNEVDSEVRELMNILGRR